MIKIQLKKKTIKILNINAANHITKIYIIVGDINVTLLCRKIRQKIEDI